MNIQRHPSEYFIKYLMLRPIPDAADDEKIIDEVDFLRLPKADKKYLEWLREKVFYKKPAVFWPLNRYHQESAKFLKSEQIWSLFHPDDSSKEASQILSDLRARPVVEDLLLGRLDPKEIAKRINTRYELFTTKDGIEAYSHYYWNTKLLRVEDWVNLFSDYELRKDKTLSILHIGPSMALHKSGFQQEVEAKTVLKDVLETLYYDLKEWKTRPQSVGKTKALSMIAHSIVKIDDQLSQSSIAIKESLQQFEKFRMHHYEHKVEDIRKLAAAGNYSNSGAKLLDTINVEVENDGLLVGKRNERKVEKGS